MEHESPELAFAEYLPDCRFRRKPATYSDLIAATLPI